MIPKEALFAMIALMAVSAAFGWVINDLYTEETKDRLERKMERTECDDAVKEADT